MPRPSLALVLVLAAVAACKSAPAGAPAPEWLVKVTGVTPESVEARRLERQAAFERGEIPEAPDPTYKKIADGTGLTAEVRAARLRNGIDPDTGERLPTQQAVAERGQ